MRSHFKKILNFVISLGLVQSSISTSRAQGNGSKSQAVTLRTYRPEDAAKADQLIRHVLTRTQLRIEEERERGSLYEPHQSREDEPILDVEAVNLLQYLERSSSSSEAMRKEFGREIALEVDVLIEKSLEAVQSIQSLIQQLSRPSQLKQIYVADISPEARKIAVNLARHLKTRALRNQSQKSLEVPVQLILTKLNTLYPDGLSTLERYVLSRILGDMYGAAYFRQASVLQSTESSQSLKSVQADQFAQAEKEAIWLVHEVIAQSSQGLVVDHSSVKSPLDSRAARIRDRVAKVASLVTIPFSIGFTWETSGRNPWQNSIFTDSTTAVSALVVMVACLVHFATMQYQFSAFPVRFNQLPRLITTPQNLVRKELTRFSQFVLNRTGNQDEANLLRSQFHSAALDYASDFKMTLSSWSTKMGQALSGILAQSGSFVIGIKRDEPPIEKNNELERQSMTRSFVESVSSRYAAWITRSNAPSCAMDGFISRF